MVRKEGSGPWSPVDGGKGEGAGEGEGEGGVGTGAGDGVTPMIPHVAPECECSGWLTFVSKHSWPPLNVHCTQAELAEARRWWAAQRAQHSSGDAAFSVADTAVFVHAWPRVTVAEHVDVPVATRPTPKSSIPKNEFMNAIYDFPDYSHSISD